MQNPAAATTGQWIVPATCAIALLYFGRTVLEPLALAAILSLALGALVRRVQRLGLRRGAATLVAVALVGGIVASITLVITLQVAAVSRELPRYRATIESKVEQVRALALRPLEDWVADMGQIVPPLAEKAREPPSDFGSAREPAPIPVEIRPARASAGDTFSRLLSNTWSVVGEGFIALVLLIFMMIEHDALRERWVRLAGEGEVARTMLALTDTDEGVSRFLLSLVAINVTFGAIIAAALWIIGVPHAALWGALSSLMRFVPYIGVPVAAACVGLFAAGADPGWALVFWSLAAYAALELILANVIEPQVYGRGSGLAPLAIVVSALFWGALWGPVGLVLSTPLTLCVVVAGRHVRALRPITILLGDAMTAPGAQRLYQRALAGEVDDVLDEARAYLRHHTLAEFCDQILLPAIALAGADLRAGRIERRQEDFIRQTIATLAESVVDVKGSHGAHRRVAPAAQRNLGEYLRTRRQARLGQWQGSLDVPVHSVVICASLAIERDQVLAELLASALRGAGLDARSTILDPDAERPAEDKSNLVATAFLMYPLREGFEAWLDGCRSLRVRLPHALIAAVRVPIDTEIPAPDEADVLREVDLIVRSFTEAVSRAPEGRPPA